MPAGVLKSCLGTGLEPGPNRTETHFLTYFKTVGNSFGGPFTKDGTPMAKKIRQIPADSAPLPQLIGVKDLAKLLAISIVTARRWEKNGTLPQSIRLGKTQHRRWNLDEVKAALAAKGAQ